MLYEIFTKIFQSSFWYHCYHYVIIIYFKLFQHNAIYITQLQLLIFNKNLCASDQIWQ